ASVVIDNINAGDKIEWKTTALHDTVLVEGVSGKFDIGGFGTTQGQPTPDQKLDFVAKVVDGDGDSSTASFSIGIDGTGPFHDGIVAGVTPSAVRSPAGSSIIVFGSIRSDDLLALLG